MVLKSTLLRLFTFLPKSVHCGSTGVVCAFVFVFVGHSDASRKYIFSCVRFTVLEEYASMLSLGELKANCISQKKKNQ